jgi:hypothetical protein
MYKRTIRMESIDRPIVSFEIDTGEAGGTVSGKMTDSAGAHWCFDIPELTPDTTYRLRIFDAEGKSLCDPYLVRLLSRAGKDDTAALPA